MHIIPTLALIAGALLSGCRPPPRAPDAPVTAASDHANGAGPAPAPSGHDSGTLIFEAPLDGGAHCMNLPAVALTRFDVAGSRSELHRDLVRQSLRAALVDPCIELSPGNVEFTLSVADRAVADGTVANPDKSPFAACVAKHLDELARLPLAEPQPQTVHVTVALEVSLVERCSTLDAASPQRDDHGDGSRARSRSDETGL